MKKIYILLAAAVCLAVSCNGGGDKDLATVHFTSFGFYAEDNPALDKDYVANVNFRRDTEIEFTFPNAIDPAIFKDLSPRFTLSGDNVTVQVGDLFLLSAEEKPVPSDEQPEVGVRAEEDTQETPSEEPAYITSLDLSAPVEIILTDGTNYKSYYISAGIESSWEKVAEGTSRIYGTKVNVAYDASSDIFYLAGTLNAEENTDKNPSLFQYKDNAVTPAFGQDGAITNRQGHAGISVAVATDGTPYVAFADYVDIEGKATAKVSVATIKNGTVQFVGTEGSIYAVNSAYAPQIFPLGTNNVWVAETNNANVTTAPALNRRLLNLCQWDGSSWTNAIAITGRSATDYGYAPRGLFVGGKAYLFVANQNVGTYSVYKNEGSGWTALAENQFPVDKNNEKLEKAGVSYYGNIGVDASGNVYILAQGKIDGENWSLALQKIKSDGSFEMYGSPIPGSETSKGSQTPSVAFGTDGKPVVAFRNAETQQPMVCYLDPATNDWGAPEAIGTEKVDAEISIKADKNGKLYVFTCESTNGHIAVYSTK